MLEWLKNILGDNYSEEIDTKVSAEIGKAFVSKADFNTKNEALKRLEGDLKSRDEQLDALKNSTGDIEELKKQIATLQTQNATDKATYEAQVAQIRLDNIVESALSAAGAKNNTAVRALLADFLKDAKVDEDGTVKGLENEIVALAKAENTAFLFTTEGGQRFKGMAPSNPGDKITSVMSKDPSEMSYDELCSYINENPEAKL